MSAMMSRFGTVATLLLVLGSTAPLARADALGAPGVSLAGEQLPTGARVTPQAAAGAVMRALNPNLPDLPDFTAGQAVDLALSPDGATLLILTSGFNRNFGPDGKFIAAQSNEYVFVYDVAGREPFKRQVLPVANTFNGIAWAHDSTQFFVAGGVDDNVHVFRRQGALFSEDGKPIALGHASGNGIGAKPCAAGIAVDPSGKRLIVANFQNDSVSLVDLETRKVVAEQDLRPGKIDGSEAGKAGGEFPLSVAFASDTLAFVASQRDREVLMLTIGERVRIKKRIKLSGQPNKMILNKDRSRLFVAADNSDTVVVIDAKDGDIEAEIATAAPPAIFLNPTGLRGANPNNLALSPDERSLFVTNGGLNTVAVIQLGADVSADDADDRKSDADEAKLPANSRVIGLIPTGWYPTAVAVGRDGKHLFVVNGKSNAGPNPSGCLETTEPSDQASNNCRSKNEYVWQLSKAGFLTLPMPGPAELARLTMQAAENNNFPIVAARRGDRETMSFLRSRIKHVVYIVKENRTYDQVLGDLEIGNGDPSLTLFPKPLTPNHHALASELVTLDNFFDSGETSNTGWLWTTAARATDFTEKEAPVNYAGRGLQYEQEGDNRNINVGLSTLGDRRAANPATPNDPDILPGNADVAAPDPSAESGGAMGTGYLWDAALRAGLSIRNYGFYGDLSRYFVQGDNLIPLIRDPFAEKRQVFYPAKASLLAHTDIYYRGYDQAFPDFYRVKEWQREFAEQVAANAMPNLTLLRVPHDHFGQFAQGIDGVNTIETEMADNDYAVGKIVETIARSPFGKDTLIFIVEDDAQNGADHVDAHRSFALVAGPYVKRHALISTRYTTVNLLRTMEEILGLPPLGLNDGLAEPMSEIFDMQQPGFGYDARLPAILRTTKLPLPPEVPKKTQLNAPPGDGRRACFEVPRRDATWWAQATAGQNFDEEDHLDVAAFNSALWRGLKGDDVAEPRVRTNADLRQDRAALLAAYAKTTGCE